MTVLAVISNRSARRTIVAHAATVLLVGAGVFVIDDYLPGLEVRPIVLGCAILATVVCSSLTLCWLLGGLLRWELLLSSLNVETIDPLMLSSASGCSAAAHGWNRLIEQGRRWQTLVELRQEIAANLRQSGADDIGALVDGLADGVVTVEPNGTITLANAAMAAICGLESPDQLLGKTLADALQADEQSAERLSGKTSQAQFTVDWSLPSTGGSGRTLRCCRRRKCGAAGSPIAFVWTIRDVTQQRLAEAMGEKFLLAATHEFRTPLANIRSHAESLEMGHESDPQSRKRFYNIIQCESLRLSQLVDELLDISRMQSGALSLDPRETDLERLVEDAAASVQAQMRQKELKFRCELPPKYPKAMVDKGKLTAAIVNLLSNAAKYTPAGGLVIFRVDVNSQQLQFSVADSGIGIASEELPLVFDRFFRSNDDRVREITGSGLGLALVQEVARLHGGNVTVESTLNQGSTFRLSIPLDMAV